MNTNKTSRLTPEELRKLRTLDFSQQNGFVKAETMLSQEVGVPGSKEREEFNAKARAWYYGEVLLHNFS